MLDEKGNPWRRDGRRWCTLYNTVHPPPSIPPPVPLFSFQSSSPIRINLNHYCATYEATEEGELRWLVDAISVHSAATLKRLENKEGAGMTRRVERQLKTKALSSPSLPLLCFKLQIKLLVPVSSPKTVDYLTRDFKAMEGQEELEERGVAAQKKLLPHPPNSSYYPNASLKHRLPSAECYR